MCLRQTLLPLAGADRARDRDGRSCARRQARQPCPILPPGDRPTRFIRIGARLAAEPSFESVRSR